MSISPLFGISVASLMPPVTNIFLDSNIIITFSEEVVNVTNVGDCATGSFELHNDTQDECTAGVLSSPDSVQYTFNPTSDFDISDRLTLTLTDAIEAIAGKVSHGGNNYTCLEDNTDVEPGVDSGWEDFWRDDGAGSDFTAWSAVIAYQKAAYQGPFTFKFKVVNRVPVMDSLVVAATSSEGLIGITSMSATDPDGHPMTFGLSLIDSASGVSEYKTEAAWQGSGFPSGLPEGTTSQDTPVFCFAEDSFGGISANSATDTCSVTVPDVTDPEMLDFSVPSTGTSPTIPVATLLASDNVTTEPNLVYQVNETDSFTSGVGTWESSDQWKADGYPSSVSEGDPPTLVTLFAASDDEAGNVSTSLTAGSTLTIPHSPEYSEQPTIEDALYDGCVFTVTATDASHTIDFDLTKNNESSWDVGVKTNIASGAQQTITADGMTAGTIANLIKTRIYDNSGGTTDQLVSSFLASFDTVSPVLTSVTPSDQKLTYVFADNANDTSDSFNLLWDTSSGSLGNTIVGVTSPYEQTGLTNGVEIFSEIVAIKGAITSTPSTEKSGTPSDVPVIKTPDQIASVKLWEPTDPSALWADDEMTSPAPNNGDIWRREEQIGIYTNDGANSTTRSGVRPDRVDVTGSVYDGILPDGKTVIQSSSLSDNEYLTQAFLAAELGPDMLGADKKWSLNLLYYKPILSSLGVIAGIHVPSPTFRSWYWSLASGVPRFIYYGSNAGTSFRGIDADVTLSGDGPFNFQVYYDGSNDDNNGLDRVQLRINGVLYESIEAFAPSGAWPFDIPTTTKNLAIGAHINDSLVFSNNLARGSDSCRGDFVFAADPSAQDLTDLNAYCNDQWGI